MSSIRTTNAKSQGLTPVWNPPVAATETTPAVDGYWLVPHIADASTVAWKRPATAVEREWCEQHREEQEAIAAVRKRRAERGVATVSVDGATAADLAATPAPLGVDTVKVAPDASYIDPPPAATTKAAPLPKAAL